MIPIGCSVKEEGFLYAQKVDGIFGLANKEDSIINQLYKEGKINKRIFSLCFSQNGGYLTLGNVYRDYHINSPVYFPITMKDVNTRNSSKQEPYANNTIHAGTFGYLQIADAVYRHIVGKYLNS